MKIIDLLKKDTLSLSFEVFPPKTETSFESVKTATEEIAKLNPAFMSVTYGAGGGTSKYTLEIAKNIKKMYNVPTLAHLTCVSSTKETVRERIADIKNAGIENVMALRGDIPEELINADRSKWDYNYAIDLIKELKEINPDFCIGGACYPEIHPESTNQKDDIKRLKEKVDAGASYLVTQIFFDNSYYYRLVKEARKRGINVPILAGIMPITNSKSLLYTAKMCGCSIPYQLSTMIESYYKHPEAMKEIGGYFELELCKGKLSCESTYTIAS